MNIRPFVSGAALAVPLTATFSYTLFPSVSLWIKGDNLLAQRYEYIAGMPMPRATFMGGVNLRSQVRNAKQTFFKTQL